MQHRSVRGRIQYLSKKPDSFNADRGSETFMFTHHGDGSVTLRATCELELPAPKVLRDVIMTMDAQNRVDDLHLRVSVADRLMGTAWYHRAGDVMELEAYAPALGRVSQRVAYPSSIEGIGTHPLVGDAYLLKAIDVSRGPHQRKLSLYMVSTDHRGASPPALGAVNILVAYVGDEEVTVPAGTFRTHHFQYLDDGTAGLAGQHPPIDLWCTADGDYVYVQGKIGGYFMSEYALVEYSVRQPN